MEGDDQQDPLVDGARALLDGHVMLDRALASRNHYPPIAVLDSVSRIMPTDCSKEHLTRANELRRLMPTYEGARDLIRIGAYQKGGDAELDRAVGLMQALNLYLTQEPGESCDFAETVAKLLQIGE